MGWYESLVDGIESVGRGIDRAVSGTIDVVGGGLDSAIETVKENPGKSALVAAAAVATGGAALAAAPTIGAVASGAGLGVAGGTLSGAAASSAGLAAIGGGSLASGGGGMLLGTQIITATGAIGGAAISGTVVKASATGAKT